MHVCPSVHGTQGMSRCDAILLYLALQEARPYPDAGADDEEDDEIGDDDGEIGAEGRLALEERGRQGHG